MKTSAMFEPQPPCEEVSRRAFVESLARGLLGVSIVPLLSRSSLASAAEAQAKAKQVIYLFMDGGMSHLDTFDPKPGSKSQGQTKPVQTNVAGVHISEHFSRLAKQMDQVAVVRSLTTQTGDHDGGKYLMRTSYQQLASTRHPALGPWVQRMLGKLNPILPASVIIGGESNHPGSGYLGSEYMPVPIGDPQRGLENSQPPKYLTAEQFDNRMDLASRFDHTFQSKYRTQEVEGYTDLYREAIQLMRSDELRVFDINQEPEEVRKAYGGDRFGMGCLLARRLVQQGVRFVEVTLGGWDMHNNLFSSMTGRAAVLDQALAALLADLRAQGLLESTLVVLTTEFGRSPDVNQNAGRDHHPAAFAGLLAGGGIQGGVVYGKTDERGHGVEDDGVSVEDFNSTIAHALGIDHQEEIYSPDQRPFTLGNGGTPVEKLFG